MEWNELRYVLPHKWRNSVAAKLPPGHLGLPFNGEMLAFLWYFKILRRPDKFIDAKRKKYGDGVGLYRTYLFGSPSIIAWFPSVNRFVLQDDALLKAWPNVDIFGSTYLVTVHGNSHARLRSYVTNAINQPEALRQITLLVQPRIVAALQSWSQKGRVKAYDETKKYRKKLEAIFRVELEKKKRQKCEGTNYDLMDGLMQIEDGEGSKLSHEEVLDNIICLVIGGYEFTSLALMWAIYYLVNYPDVLEKLRVVEETIRMANIAVQPTLLRINTLALLGSSF
ncbi:hypothetical protein TIFTF001_014920 [Ficus carica]|uniref:Cytochrome P450 n=1 Tax=Ficus carica TaxID=3494 RepID=A0AA88AKN5_FICCA|nr:hypothetical protein TIFTF001_014920 [Ficus carica]